MEISQKIQNFILRKASLPKLVVIYGPTACGKTSMSIDVAQILGSQIIGADSRQIYRELNIGTGKIMPHETQGIPHHMIDILNPDTPLSLGEYKKQTESIIQTLSHSQLQYPKEGSMIPVLCGGTGLYIDSIIYDFDIPKAPSDLKLRTELEKEAKKYGNQYIFEKLQKIDPEYAKELHPNNLNYVIRAIEVKMLTGKSKTQFRGEKKLKYDVLFLTPYTGDREALYQKINIRVQQMFDEGLVKEVQKLLEKYGKNDILNSTIGYQEVIGYLEGNSTLDECINLVQQHNRNYAKRQLTWFKKYE